MAVPPMGRAVTKPLGCVGSELIGPGAPLFLVTDPEKGRRKEAPLAPSSARTYGPLTIRIEEHEDSLALRAIGELDISSAPALEDSLLHAFESAAPSVTLDLTEVSFIDTTGLRVVAWAHENSRAEGDRVRMADSASIRRRLPS